MKTMTLDEFIQRYPFLRFVKIENLAEIALNKGIVLSTFKKVGEL